MRGRRTHRAAAGCAAVMLAGLLLAAAPAGAAGGGGGGGDGSSGGSGGGGSASGFGGEYIRLQPVWVPLDEGSGPRTRYVPLDIRLVPARPELNEEACYATPWVVQAFVLHLNDKPMSRSRFEDLEALSGELLAVAEAAAGPGLFHEIRLSHDLAPAEGDTKALSEQCR